MIKPSITSIICLAIMKIKRQFLSRFKGTVCLVWMRFCGVEISSNVCMRGWCFFWKNPKAQLKIGQGVHFNAGMVENPVSGGNKLVLVAGHEGAHLSIGKDSAISASIIYARSSISIGERVMIGAGCAIYDNDFHSIHSYDRRHGNKNIGVAPVVIENDVWLGAEVTILKGVRIGKGSVVGAKSLVTQDIPEGVLVAGNPARVIKVLDESS